MWIDIFHRNGQGVVSGRRAMSEIKLFSSTNVLTVVIFLYDNKVTFSITCLCKPQLWRLRHIVYSSSPNVKLVCEKNNLPLVFTWGQQQSLGKDKKIKQLHVFSIPYSLVMTYWERVYVLALLCVVFSCAFVSFPYGVPGPGGGGTFIYSSCVGSGPASTVHSKKYQEFQALQKCLKLLKQPQKISPILYLDPKKRSKNA